MLNTKESIPLLQEQKEGEDGEKQKLDIEKKIFEKIKKEEKREERYKLMMKALKEYNII
jgi:hypothetical protein